MNIYNFRNLWLVALFFIVGCQKSNPIISKPATLKSTVSNELLNEIAQVTNPNSKIHVATSTIVQVPLVHKTSTAYDLGTLRLGKDNCFYIELDNGIKVLPVLVSEYSSPENLSLSYTKALGKKVIGFYKGDTVDLMSERFNVSNIGWITLPPHLQCDISRVHQYRTLDLYLGGTAEYLSRISFEPIIDYSNTPKKTMNLSYIGVYNYGIRLDESKDVFIGGNQPVDKGVLFTENDCLYIRFNNGKVALPIFKTQRTYWQDTKNTLRASGKDWQLGKAYSFGITSSDTGERFDSDFTTIITPPHPSCNTKQVRYVEAIYEPAEFEQKAAAANYKKQTQ